MRRVARRATLLAPVAALAGCAALGGAGADADAGGSVSYAQDYAEHEPLRVEGYPSAGSLQLVQEVVWRIGDGAPDRLAVLGSSDSAAAERERTARRWVAEFGKGAGGKVTASFCGTGPVDGRQVVTLRFSDTGQTKVLHVRVDGVGGEDGWRVRMPPPAGDAPETPPQGCP